MSNYIAPITNIKCARVCVRLSCQSKWYGGGGTQFTCTFQACQPLLSQRYGNFSVWGAHLFRYYAALCVYSMPRRQFNPIDIISPLWLDCASTFAASSACAVSFSSSSSPARFILISIMFLSGLMCQMLGWPFFKIAIMPNHSFGRFQFLHFFRFLCTLPFASWERYLLKRFPLLSRPAVKEKEILVVCVLCSCCCCLWPGWRQHINLNEYCRL